MGEAGEEEFDAALRLLLVVLERFFQPTLPESELAVWRGQCERALTEGEHARLPFPKGVAWLAIRKMGRDIAVYVWATEGYDVLRPDLRELRRELGLVSSRINRIREAPPESAS